MFPVAERLLIKLRATGFCVGNVCSQISGHNRTPTSHGGPLDTLLVIPVKYLVTEGAPSSHGVLGNLTLTELVKFLVIENTPSSHEVL